MALSQANVLASQKETYRKALPIMYANWDVFSSRAKSRADIEPVGPRTLRLPKRMSPGGQSRFFNPDGGDLGRGSGPDYQAEYFTPLGFLTAVEFNKSAEWNTAKSSLATVNATDDLMSMAMEEFMVQRNKLLQGSGDCVVATISSGAGTNTITMTADPGAKWLRENNKYATYNAAKTTQRTGGTTLMTLLTIDEENGIVTVDGTPTGQINGDVLMTEGVSGASPTGYYGLRYHHSSASTGTHLGLDRGTYPQLRTPEVVASAAITGTHTRLLKNKILAKVGPTAFKSGSWEWYGHMSQLANLEEQGLAIRERNASRSGGYDPNIDVDSITIDGIPVLVDHTASTSRLDLIDWDNWGRGETLGVGLYEAGDLTQFPIYGASGGLAAAEIFYLCVVDQFFVDDPRRGGYISSARVPTGYW